MPTVILRRRYANPLSNDYSWQTLLGWALMMGRHYEPAVAHCHEAIALDPKSWVALEGLARCAGEQGQYHDAIAWQEKALDALPPPMSFVSAYLWPRITEWANQLGDSERAFEVAEKGFRAEPGSRSGGCHPASRAREAWDVSGRHNRVEVSAFYSRTR